MELLEDAMKNKHVLSTGFEGYHVLEHPLSHFLGVKFETLKVFDTKFSWAGVCIRVDLLLQGGLREGLLTELVGPSSSGKTQVRPSANFGSNV